MSKRKGVQKDLDDNAHSQGNKFSSCSSMTLRPRLRKNEVTGNKSKPKELPKKKIKIGVSSNSVKEVFQGQGQGQGQGSMGKLEFVLDDLPPEMLTRILECVDSWTLFFGCRHINRKWNSISSGILHYRREAEISFRFKYGRFFTDTRRQEEASPYDFLNCFKESQLCPFTTFYFLIKVRSSSSNLLECEEFNAFLTHFNFGAPTSAETSTTRAKTPMKMKCLKLDFYFKYFGDAWLDCLIKKLKDLLVDKIPYLEEFGLNFSGESNAPNVNLFHQSRDSTLNANAIEFPIPLQFQLPHLKVLHFKHGALQQCPGIYSDLLTAAVNLKKIRFDKNEECTTEEILILFSTGKPLLVQNSVLKITDEFLASLKEQQQKQQQDSPAPIPVLVLKFEKIKMDIHKLDPDSSVLLENLLELSKNTLMKLKMGSTGLQDPDLLNLKLPTFNNLRQLKLEQSRGWSSVQLFPAGVRSMDNRTTTIFPAVTRFKFRLWDWRTGFPQQDSIPFLPRLETLTMPDGGCLDRSIPTLASMCPNLKHLHINKREREYTVRLELLPLGRAIWTHMTQLETLEIAVDVDSPENNPTALDSCFTGISLEECRRLVEVMDAKNTLEKWGIPTKIPQSKLQAEREHPSILDMKDLKKLTITPYSKWKKLERAEFQNKLTWVSEEFAFKLMPHLKQE